MIEPFNKSNITSEIPVDQFITNTYSITSPNYGIIIKVRPAIKFVDYPHIFQFEAIHSGTALLSEVDKNELNAGFGTSLTFENAMVRSIGEAFDRYASQYYNSKILVAGTSDDIKNPLNLDSLTTFDDKIIANLPQAIRAHESIFRWVKGFNHSNGEKIMVPAQLVYQPYKFIDREPMLKLPTSSGSATGSSPWSAALRGLLELIERDTFMFTYMFKINGNSLELENIELSDKYREFIKTLNVYNLELHVSSLPNQFGLFVINATIIDKKSINIGVPELFQMGLSAGTDLKACVEKAIDEALQGLYWLRLLIQTEKPPERYLNELLKTPDSISTHSARGLYWCNKGSIDNIKFLWQGHFPAYHENHYYKMNDKQIFLNIVNKLKEYGYTVLTVDLTLDILREKSIFVVRTIVPEFISLHLSEKYRQYKSPKILERARNLGLIEGDDYESKINHIPHPFL
jgi:ribosomal protein S12 methylthiotransferase accessory factor